MPRRPALPKPDSAPKDSLNIFSSESLSESAPKRSSVHKKDSLNLFGGSDHSSSSSSISSSASSSGTSTPSSSSSSSSGSRSNSPPPPPTPPTSEFGALELNPHSTDPARHHDERRTSTTSPSKKQRDSLNVFAHESEVNLPSASGSTRTMVQIQQPSGGHSHMSGILSTPSDVASQTPAHQLQEKSQGVSRRASAPLSSIQFNDNPTPLSSPSTCTSRGRVNMSTLSLRQDVEPEPLRTGRKMMHSSAENSPRNILDASTLPPSSDRPSKNQSHALDKNRSSFDLAQEAPSSSSSFASRNSSRASTGVSVQSEPLERRSIKIHHQPGGTSSGNIISWK